MVKSEPEIKYCRVCQKEMRREMYSRQWSKTKYCCKEHGDIVRDKTRVSSRPSLTTKLFHSKEEVEE
jgi:hypothetical protein